MVITAGMLRGLSPEESGRFGFIIAIPAILGAGLREFINLGAASTLSIELVIGTLVAGVCGYWAIKFLIDCYPTHHRRCGVQGTDPLTKRCGKDRTQYP